MSACLKKYNWKNIASVCRKKMEKRGIDPLASRMRSARSTIWATSPLNLLRYNVSALWTDDGGPRIQKIALRSFWYSSTRTFAESDAECTKVISMHWLNASTDTSVSTITESCSCDDANDMNKSQFSQLSASTDSTNSTFRLRDSNPCLLSESQVS